MKNKFNETDTIYEKAYWIMPKPLKGFSKYKGSPNEWSEESRKIIWRNPIILKDITGLDLVWTSRFKKPKEVLKAPVRIP